MSTLDRLVGTVLGDRYRLERPIGEGGMGAVFEATQLSLSRRVAVKVLKPAFEQDDERIKRFELETEAIARLQHPHIVHVLDAGRASDGTLFLAMELVEGQTVRQLLRGGPLPWQRALTLAESVASALVAAHAAGVIHRDLKAENVIVWDKAGRPDFAKVLDFGVAKVTSRVEAPAVTGTGFVAGTPGCMSPEQILGRGDDPRSDLYSLGVLLFEMLTGRAPYLANNAMELMLKHLNEPVPRPAEALAQLGLDLPPAVDALVTGLLQKDASLRPANAQVLVDALRALRESTAATVPDLRTPLPTPLAMPATHAHGAGALALDGTTVGSKVIAAPTGALGAAPPDVTATSPSRATAPGSTSPTVAIPAGAEATLPRWRRRRAALVIAAVLAVGGALTAGFFRSAYTSSVSSMNPTARAHLDRAEQAYWELDLQRVRDETELALAIDPHAAWGHLLRAQAALLDDGLMATADAEHELARRAADERYRRSMMFQVTHLQHLVSFLSARDTRDALERFDAHGTEFHCLDEAAETLMFAVKLLQANQDRARAISLAEHAARTRGGPMPAAAAFVLARALRAQGTAAATERARALLQEQLTRNKAPLLAEELADLELAEGNRDAANTLLEGVTARDRGRLAAQLRLAALSGEHGAFEPLVADLRRLKPSDLRRAEGLFKIGENLAATGRLREADALLLDAFDGAKQAHPDAAVEIASLAQFLFLLADDYDRASAWYERVKAWAPRGRIEASVARTKMFSLAASFLLSRKRTDADRGAESELDYEVLMNAKRDIPLVMQQIEFSRALWKESWADALRATSDMPSCFRHTYIGLAHTKHGLAQSVGTAATPKDPAGAQRSFREALSALEAVTTPSGIAACTAGQHVIPYLQSIVVALAFAQRALAAQALDDVEAARATIAGFRAHWPYADADGVDARDIASVEGWLAKRAPAGDLTRPGAPRKNPRREGP